MFLKKQAENASMITLHRMQLWISIVQKTFSLQYYIITVVITVLYIAPYKICPIIHLTQGICKHFIKRYNIRQQLILMLQDLIIYHLFPQTQQTAKFCVVMTVSGVNPYDFSFNAFNIIINNVYHNYKKFKIIIQ